MEKNIQEILAKYPQEIVDLFHTDITVDGYEVETIIDELSSSPFEKLINKFKKKEDEKIYQVIFTFKKN